MFNNGQFIVTLEARILANSTLCDVPCHYQLTNSVWGMTCIWTWKWQVGPCVDVLERKINAVVPFVIGNVYFLSSSDKREMIWGGGKDRTAIKCSEEISQA